MMLETRYRLEVLLLAVSLIVPSVVNAQTPAEIAKRMVEAIPDPSYKRVRAGLAGQLARMTLPEKAAISDWDAAVNEVFRPKGSKKPKVKLINYSTLELLEILRKSQELYDVNGQFRSELAATYGKRFRKFPVETLPEWQEPNFLGPVSVIFNLIRLPDLFEGSDFNNEVYQRYLARFKSMTGSVDIYWASAQGGDLGTMEGEPSNLSMGDAKYNLLGVSELFPNDRLDRTRFITAYPIAVELLAQERAKTGTTMIGAVGSSKTVVLDGSPARSLQLRDGLTALWVKVSFGRSDMLDLNDVIFYAESSEQPLRLAGVDMSCANSMMDPPSFHLLRSVELKAGITEAPEAINLSDERVELKLPAGGGNPLLAVRKSPASVCFLFVTPGKIDWYSLQMKKYDVLNVLQYLTNHVIPFR